MVENTSFTEELLEPVIDQAVVRSMSDVFLGINRPIEELEDPLIASCNDEPGLLDRSLTHSDELPSTIVYPESSSVANDLSQNLIVAALVLRYSNITTKKNLRLTCRSWYNATSFFAPPIRPASDRLPTEILLNIYNSLGAKDFNAARRTCRGWMLASLNKSLLIKMLSRGGWNGERLTKDEKAAQNRSTTDSSQEWILSQHLSRQCTLASHWTGNGLDARPAIVDNSEIDFSELAHGYASQKRRTSGGLIFTSSICGKYLLIAKDTLVYIYGLEDGLVRPLTSIVCPRRVLTMSMNASAGRDAVAALLEGSMGMVCELRYGCFSLESSPGDKYVEGKECQSQMNTQPSTPSGMTSDLQDAINPAEHHSPVVLRGPDDQNADLDSFNAIELKTHNQGFSLEGTDDTNTHDRNLIAQTWNLSLRGPLKNLRSNSKAAVRVQNIPIESGTSTFYRHLCSEDDPPRNVSICPQRRCVAFGCSAGIELHWIDALTGQSLSRWFPLTSPSDHLYFLSPRSGFESAKKLRLISSAAHPNHRPATSRRLFNHLTKSSFWGSFGYESRSRLPQVWDHYHAIPLSDGHHVVFIDPSNDRLTLGCDAPLGGPTKLLRKVVFNPPEEKVVPRIYSAAADMSSGARIAAVYENTIMLYSIPPDLLTFSRLEQAGENRDVNNISPVARNPDDWFTWWDEPPATKCSEQAHDSPIWPITVSGTEIARLSDICELAIQSRPDIVIWAFTYSSQCRTWRLRNFVDARVQARQVVDGGGLVRDSYSVDGSSDVMMRDGPLFAVAASLVDGWVHGYGDADNEADADADADEVECPQPENSVFVGFDGNASGVLNRLPKALATEMDGWVDYIDVVGCADAWFDGAGDVVTWREVEV